MDYLMKNLPDNFQMISIMELAEPLLEQESGPFVVVALQVCLLLFLSSLLLLCHIILTSGMPANECLVD